MHLTVWERGRAAFSERRMLGLRDSWPEVHIVEGLKWGVLLRSGLLVGVVVIGGLFLVLVGIMLICISSHSNLCMAEA